MYRESMPSKKSNELAQIISRNQQRFNLSTAQLITQAVLRQEGTLSASGAFVTDTGEFTGRSPKDRFIVKEGQAASRVHWGNVNKPLSAAHYQRLYADMMAYAQDKQLFIQSLSVGTHEEYSLSVQVITEYAWHNVFATNLFVRKSLDNAKNQEWTVIDLPGFVANVDQHGGQSSTMIVLNMDERVVLITNTEYAGEIKKSLFAVMNYELPAFQVLPMHCSANCNDVNSALFFGLSGTGKTTLSADADYTLIGDDEHGWADCIFNFEGGCYAKAVNLSETDEPLIYAASNRFGAIQENVILDAHTSQPDFTDISKTENTRTAYPINFISNASSTGIAPEPEHIFFLTADAYGVLPPLSRLDTNAALYHFLSGYTSKLAGTERGITKPEATFSTCFGSPFLPLSAGEYARLFKQKIKQNQTKIWLVNTGWQGGAYGVGKRIRLSDTRRMVSAARNGELDKAQLQKDPIFKLSVVTDCPGVKSNMLPWDSWDDQAAFETTAKQLAQQFCDNFRQYQDQVDVAVLQAGPG